MTHINVIRAWKDEDYRNSLTEAERAALPEHPAGLVELEEKEMAHVDGGYNTTFCSYAGICQRMW